MTEEEFAAFAEREHAGDLGPYTIVPCECGEPDCLGWSIVHADHPFRRG